MHAAASQADKMFSDARGGDSGTAVICVSASADDRSVADSAEMLVGQPTRRRSCSQIARPIKGYGSDSARFTDRRVRVDVYAPAQIRPLILEPSGLLKRC